LQSSVSIDKSKTYNPDKGYMARSMALLVQKDPELGAVVTAWPKLPAHIKAAVKALIQVNSK